MGTSLRPCFLATREIAAESRLQTVAEPQLWKCSLFFFIKDHMHEFFSHLLRLLLARTRAAFRICVDRCSGLQARNNAAGRCSCERGFWTFTLVLGWPRGNPRRQHKAPRP